MELKAYAKLNLTLDILGRLKTGYHEIHSVMHQIELHDDVILGELEKNKIEVECRELDIPLEKNIIFKIIDLIKNKYNIKKGIKVIVKKNIPIAAGLAGGSSDAAAVLKALNDLWNLNLEDNDLIEIGEKVGKDIPFHVIGSSCEISGTGEKIRKINTDIKLNFVIIKPDFDISTKEAYSNLNYGKIGQKRKTKEMVKGLETDNIIEIADNLHNDFEYSVNNEIKKIKKELKNNGAMNSLMSGSGSCVFGLFETEEKAVIALNNLKDKYKKIFLTKTK